MNAYDSERAASGIVEAAQFHIEQQARIAAEDIAVAHTKPSAVYRPRISRDGSAWCALYGENIQEGVAGFGDTPAEAMSAFDKAWENERIPLHRDPEDPEEG